MKFYIYLFFIIIIFFTNFINCQDIIELNNELKKISGISESKSYKISIDSSATIPSNYEYIKVSVMPNSPSSITSIYMTTKNTKPSKEEFEMSSIEKGENIIYVTRRSFENKNPNSFMISINCQNCNYDLTFQLMEMMFVDINKRLDFLTYDEKTYLIKFNKIGDGMENKLLVSSTGGAGENHGLVNNVKMELYYHLNENNQDERINVNSDIMLNGAVSVFQDNNYSSKGDGYYFAKINSPENTYITFMFRKKDSINEIEINGRGIYGYLEKNEKDIIKIKKNDDGYNRQYQISLSVKGNLDLYTSSNSQCEEENTKKKINIKNESNNYIFISSSDLDNGIQYICVTNKNNENYLYNSYILEVFDVTDQKKSTVNREPLVNGFIYNDELKKDEVRTYRHSKFIGQGDTKYNAKLISGLINVVYIKCTTFPDCAFDKDIVDGKDYAYYPIQFKSIDNYFTANVDKTMEYNLNSPTQYLLTVLCLTDVCKYEVSFSDSEDALVLKEDIRISHYISPSSHNYYHFNIPKNENIKKVIVELRTMSGDCNMEIGGDVQSKKKYFLHNNEINEFYQDNFEGLYFLNISSNIASFYLLSFTVVKNDQDEENKKYNIGLGVSVIESIKIGNTKKIFSMFHDKTRGENLGYVANFYPINCNIKVKFFDENVGKINFLYQHEIDPSNKYYNEDNYDFTVYFESFNEGNEYEDKMCMFYISSQEISKNSQTIIAEGAPTGFTITQKTKSPAFLYPHSAGENDILIKYNIENNYPVQMDIMVGNTKQNSVFFSRSSFYVIQKDTINKLCPNKIQFCGIEIRFSYYSENNSDDNIPNITLNIIMKSKDNIPSFLKKNTLLIDLVAQNSIQYYIVDLNPDDRGDVVLNFRKGSGKMFAKLISKTSPPETGSNWKKRVKLPLPTDSPDPNCENNNYKHRISYKAPSKKDKVCNYGCELYIGVISTDVIESQNPNSIDYLEYSIFIKPDLNIVLTEEDKNQIAVRIQQNEYIIGTVEENAIDYYFIDIIDDCDSIVIEFQSESCILYINEEDKYPGPNSYKWIINSKASNNIFEIKKGELGVDNLKGHSFKIALNSDNYDEVLSMNYIFRVRVPKRTMKSIVEINSNINTVCNITEKEGYCDLLYAISDYELKSFSSLTFYAESEMITEITLYSKTVSSYLFDSMSEEKINDLLPRKNKYQKSSENQNIKNFLEFSIFELLLIIDTKIFFLISVKSSKPGIINIYTSKRDHVLSTILNGFYSSFYNRPQKKINFEITQDQTYTYHITSVDGEGEAYFIDKEKKEVGSRHLISGSGSLVSMSLPSKEKNVNALIVEPLNEKFKFFIGENVFPQVRIMEKIKFGSSGKINYDNNPEFPIVYYLKILDEEESININLNIKNLSSSFISNSENEYDDKFDISCYIVDESMLISMMRDKNSNPPLNKIINGQYDKSITTAKIYIASSKIKSENIKSSKYIIVSLKKSEDTKSIFKSFGVDFNIMPLSDKAYNSPYNQYINGNLLNDKSNQCNYHKLRPGSEEDEYMYIEFSKISPRINFRIYDSNNNEINFIEKMAEKYGKYIYIIKVEKNNNILLEVCKINKDDDIPYTSSNYVFRIKSDKVNNFKEHIIKSDEIKYNYNRDKGEVSLSIPKILNINETKAEEAKYSIRVFSKYAFKDDETTNSISFISYDDYSTYLYYVKSDNNGIDNIEMTIKEFPKSEPYYISVIGITTNNEEIFSYKQIIIENKNEKKNVDDDSNKSGALFYIIIILLIVVLVGITIFFMYKFYLLNKQKADLSEEVRNISMKLSREDEDKRDGEEQRESLVN